MGPKFLGKDPGSPEGGSPAVWDDGDSYVIQGWRVTDPEEVRHLLHAAGQERVPAQETLIRIPKRLMPVFPEAGK
jgi:hypothetical protein